MPPAPLAVCEPGTVFMGVGTWGSLPGGLEQFDAPCPEAHRRRSGSWAVVRYMGHAFMLYLVGRPSLPKSKASARPPAHIHEVARRDPRFM
jgi:hypothetical protein